MATSMEIQDSWKTQAYPLKNFQWSPTDYSQYQSNVSWTSMVSPYTKKAKRLRYIYSKIARSRATCGWEHLCLFKLIISPSNPSSNWLDLKKNQDVEGFLCLIGRLANSMWHCWNQLLVKGIQYDPGEVLQRVRLLSREFWSMNRLALLTDSNGVSTLLEIKNDIPPTLLSIRTTVSYSQMQPSKIIKHILVL